MWCDAYRDVGLDREEHGGADSSLDGGTGAGPALGAVAYTLHCTALSVRAYLALLAHAVHAAHGLVLQGHVQARVHDEHVVRLAVV